MADNLTDSTNNKLDDSTADLLEDETLKDTTAYKLPSKVKQRAMIVTILFLIFSSYCADTTIIPFFPSAATSKGLSSTETGIVFSAYDFSRFLAAPIVGSLLTRWHPKQICAIGSAITGLACVGFGVADFTFNGRIFLALCIITRLIAGVGSAMLNVAGTSLLMKGTSYQPGTIVGIIETMNGFGYATGPAIGAVLYQLVGYTWVFCILGGCILGLFLVALLVVPKVEEKDRKGQKNFLSLCAIPGVFILFLGWTCFKLVESSRATQISTFITSTFQTGPSMVALLFSWWAILYMISGVVFTKFFVKKYAFYVVLFTWSIQIVLTLLVVPSPPLDILFHGKSSIWLPAVVVSLICCISITLLIAPFPAALDLSEVNGHARDSLHTYGMLTGLMNCGLCLGSTIGPVLSGAFTDLVGFAWDESIFAALNLFMAILIGAYLLYMRCTNQPLSLPNENKMVEDNDTVDYEQDIAQKIDEVCSERMKICIKETKFYTEV